MFNPDVAESRASDPNPTPTPNSTPNANTKSKSSTIAAKPQPKNPSPVARMRKVPPAAYLKLFLGGFLIQFGWLFLGISIALLWYCLLIADISNKYYFGGNLETAAGVITASKTTGFRSGGNGSNKGAPFYANHYSFVAGNGNEYKGVSYEIGLQIGKGEKVEIEYPKNNPAVSRIQGMRWQCGTGKTGLIPIVAVFLIFSAGLILAGVMLGVKKYRLLAFGRITTCWVKARTRTNGMVGDQYIYHIRFEFKTPNDVRHTVDSTMPLPAVVDGNVPIEYVVYDPWLPVSAEVLGAMPPSLRMDRAGNIADKPSFFRWLYPVIPAAILLAHAAGVVLWKLLMK